MMRDGADGTYCFNWLEQQLPSSEAKRFYAQDMAMLAATDCVVSLMEKQGVTRVAMANRIGKSKGLVSQLLSGSRNMTLKSLGDMLWALGFEVSSIAVRPLGESRIHPGQVDGWLDTECEVGKAEASSAKEFEVEGTSALVAA